MTKEEREAKMLKMITEGYAVSTISSKAGVSERIVWSAIVRLKQEAAKAKAEAKAAKVAMKAMKAMKAEASLIEEQTPKKKIIVKPAVHLETRGQKKERVLRYIQGHLQMDIYEMAQQLHINVDDLSRLSWENMGVKLKNDTAVYAGEVLGKKVRHKGEYSNKAISPIVEEYYQELKAAEEAAKADKKKKAGED